MELNLPKGKLLANTTRIAVARSIRKQWPAIQRKAEARGFACTAVLPRTDNSVRLMTESVKTVKGRKYGQVTGVLYLPPAGASGVQVCLYRSKQCEASCLGPQGNGGGSGQLALPAAARAAQWRMALLLGAPALFGALLVLESRAIHKRAQRLGMQAAVRCNGSSDLPQLSGWLRAHIDTDVKLYDYTKDPAAATAQDGVHRTFSYSGYNLRAARKVLAYGGNVAVVFDACPRKGEPIPGHWEGSPVLDGDKHDARYLDAPGHVVGLRFKQTKNRRAVLLAAGKFVAPVRRTLPVL